VLTVAQASSPAGDGGVSPSASNLRTGAVLETAAGDGSATEFAMIFGRTGPRRVGAF